MSRFIEHSINLDTVKHSQNDLYFRTDGVYCYLEIICRMMSFNQVLAKGCEVLRAH